LGVAVGLAVLAAVLMYGAYAALQGSDQLNPGSDRTTAPQASSAGWAEDNVRAVQEKLREAGLYFGEIDGAYSSELAAALGRYQIRNGLPITGQLDAETGKALGAKPAVTAATPNDQVRTSQTWERLRKNDRQFPGKTVWRAPSPSANGITTGTPQSASAATAPRTNETENTTALPPHSAPAVRLATAGSSPMPDFSTERLRDYVGAFVLAGLDPQVGAEAAFFADRVQYYNEGMKDREKIREDLKRYDSRWPGRKFWLAGDITVKPETDKRVRVTFPLRYELRNGGKRSSGKMDKTLILERAGDDLQIVAVNERKAE
jgi:peptidoglycan hydrolase-like protein with peptidoglycan-binding domain